MQVFGEQFIAQIDRNSLREQVANILRDLIVSGRIKPGTKVTERDVADMLKISRMPARDALLDLERQGLIISKPGGRYVIQLNEADIRNIYNVRLALEKLSVEEAVAKIQSGQKVQLLDILGKMKQAVDENDRAAYTSSDLEFHELIWDISNNPYLVNMISSLAGPIFMFIASQTRFEENWRETLELHTTLANAICNQQLDAALKTIEEHMLTSLDLTLKIFKAEQ